MEIEKGKCSQQAVPEIRVLYRYGRCMALTVWMTYQFRAAVEKVYHPENCFPVSTFSGAFCPISSREWRIYNVWYKFLSFTVL